MKKKYIVLYNWFYASVVIAIQLIIENGYPCIYICIYIVFYVFIISWRAWRKWLKQVKRATIVEYIYIYRYMSQANWEIWLVEKNLGRLHRLQVSRKIKSDNQHLSWHFLELMTRSYGDFLWNNFCRKYL